MGGMHATPTSSAESPDSQTSPKLGEVAPTIADYDNFKQLGAGTFGTVFAATNNRTRRGVVVKLVGTREGDTGRNECDGLRRVGGHPSVCEMYRCFDLDDTMLLIEMEAVVGTDLFTYLSGRVANLTESEAVVFFRPLCSALAHCHAHGVAHREYTVSPPPSTVLSSWADVFSCCSIKPENVMVIPGTDPLVLKLIDFGLCEFQDPDNCTNGSGSVDFASPETVRCALRMIPAFDARLADVWSLGIVLFELVAWKYPFQRAERLEALHEDRPQSPLHFSRKNATSAAYQNLVQFMVTDRPKDRITAASALTHPWVVEHCG